MRYRTLTAGLTALVMTLLFAPAASAAVQHDAYNASVAWATAFEFDEETGAGYNVHGIVGEPRGEQASLFVFGSTTTPCGDDEFASESFFGEGPATFSVGGQLAEATVRATLDLIVEQRDCFGEETFDVRRDVTIAMDLTGEGKTTHERETIIGRIPSVQRSSRNDLSTGRLAVGTITVGDLTLAVSDGRISHTHGIYNANPSAFERLAAGAATIFEERDSLTYAETGWSTHDHAGSTSVSNEWSAGAFISGNGETLVGIEGEDAIFDEVNECAIITWTEGYAPGIITIAPNYTSATAAAVMDLFVVEFNGCDDTFEVEIIEGVPLSLSIGDTGPKNIFNRITSVLVPSEWNSRGTTHVVSRFGSGSYQLGDDAVAGDWAVVGNETYRYHEVAR